MNGYLIAEFAKCKCGHDAYTHLTPIGFRYPFSPCSACECRDYTAMITDADCCCGDEDEYGKCKMHK